MAAYLEQYQGYLETEMAAGGTPEHMQECVDEYNAAGRVGYRASPLYEQWAAETKFLCTTCQSEFLATEGTPDPTTETTCDACTRKLAPGDVRGAGPADDTKAPPA